MMVRRDLRDGVDASPGIYVSASDRGAAWLCAMQNDDGSYGTRPLPLAAYYKTPLALAQAERSQEGAAALDWLLAHYRGADGHIHDASPPARYCDLYEQLWVAWGAHALAQDAMARSTLRYALRFFDPRSGGFAGSVAKGALQRRQDVRSTALGGLVSLATGRQDVAERAASFLLDTLALQPSPATRFFLVREPQGQLVTSFPVELGRFFCLTPGQPDALHYAFGLAVSLLSMLHGESGDPASLAAAEAYADLCELHGSAAFHHAYSGKLGLGLALLANTPDARLRSRHRERAVQIADYLCGIQASTGEWRPRAACPGQAEQPLEYTLDRTAEYVLWLRLIARALRTGLLDGLAAK